MAGFFDGLVSIGLFSAAIAFAFHDIEAWRARRRERNGLLHLVDTEIHNNDTILRTCQMAPSFISPLTIDALRTENWDGAKVQLAQLLKPDHTKWLGSYFSRVQGLKTMVNDERLDDTKKTIFNRLRSIRAAGAKARDYGQRYLQDPDYIRIVIPDEGDKTDEQSQPISDEVALQLIADKQYRQDLLSRLKAPHPEDANLPMEVGCYIRRNPDDAEVQQALVQAADLEQE